MLSKVSWTITIRSSRQGITRLCDLLVKETYLQKFIHEVTIRQQAGREPEILTYPAGCAESDFAGRALYLRIPHSRDAKRVSSADASAPLASFGSLP